MIHDRDIAYIEKRLEELGNKFKGNTITFDQFVAIEQAVLDFRMTYTNAASNVGVRTSTPRKKDDAFDRAMKGI